MPSSPTPPAPANSPRARQGRRFRLLSSVIGLPLGLLLLLAVKGWLPSGNRGPGSVGEDPAGTGPGAGVAAEGPAAANPGAPVRAPAGPPEAFRRGKAAGYLPNDWFHLQRAFPGTTYRPEAHRAAMAQARTDRAEVGASGRGSGTWELVGPVNIGGRVTAVAVHPDTPARIYAGIAAGGVFRSDDGGTSWTPIFDEVGVPSIGAIAIDPDDPDRIYVGTGEANASGDSFAGNGVYVSEDGGANWTHLGLGPTEHIGRIVIDPADPSRLFVAALGSLWQPGPDRGVFRSTNAGGSWEKVLFVSDSTSVVDLAIDPSDPSRLYAAAWERLRGPDRRKVGGHTSGVYRSTDGGTSWAELTSGLPQGSTVGRIGLAIAASAPQTLYAIYADDPGNFLGLYKSTNGGNSWARANDSGISDVYSSYGWYFGNVRVSPTDPNDVYAMGLIFYRSTNGGTSWSERWINAHVDHHDHWIDPGNPNRQMLVGDGGVYLSTDDGGSWSHVETLPITQFYAGTVDPQNLNRVYGGAQDNGTSRTTTGSIDDWEEVFGGDGFYCLVHPQNSSRLWVEYQYGNLYYSGNDGGSWSTATSNIPSGERRNWATPVVGSPSDPDARYYGTYRIWRSTSNTAWTSISPDLTQGGSSVYHTVSTIAVAASNFDRIYAGTADGRVWTTANGGANWTRIDAGLPERWVTRVAVDPLDDRIAYVAHSGYRWGEITPHLHRTTDAGATWTAIDADLPDAPVNALAIDPDVPTRIFAGLDVGVYVSENAGDSWFPYGAGLPLGVIHDLHFHDATRTLTAFTHARSAWQIDVPTTTDVAEGDGEGEPGGAGGDGEDGVDGDGGAPGGPWNGATAGLGAEGGLRVVGAHPFVYRIELLLRARGEETAGVLTLVDVQGRTLLRRSVELRAGEAHSLSLGEADGLRDLPRGVYMLRWASPRGEEWGTARVVRAER